MEVLENTVPLAPFSQKQIVIFGPGRVGRNMAAYFKNLGHSVEMVTRIDFENRGDSLDAKLSSADIVAAAIPDDLINTWRLALNDRLTDKTIIHFSGANSFQGISSYHPLFSFPTQVLSNDVIAKIAIIREEGRAPFSDIIPGTQNPELVIPADRKALYHAIAVLSGNFSAFVWNKCATVFEDQLGEDPSQILGPYFESIVERFKEQPQNSITGPVARQDRTSVNRNLESLDDHPELLALYQSFLCEAWPQFEVSGND